MASGPPLCSGGVSAAAGGRCALRLLAGRQRHVQLAAAEGWRLLMIRRLSLGSSPVTVHPPLTPVVGLVCSWGARTGIAPAGPGLPEAGPGVGLGPQAPTPFSPFPCILGSPEHAAYEAAVGATQ